MPGMNDRPGRQQKDSRLAGAEGLVIDPDAGPLDVPLLVRLSRSQLLMTSIAVLTGTGLARMSRTGDVS